MDKSSFITECTDMYAELHCIKTMQLVGKHLFFAYQGRVVRTFAVVLLIIHNSFCLIMITI